MRVAYIVHDLADAAVQRRRSMLSRAGAKVATVGFRRAHAPRRPPEPCVVEIGVTRDAALGHRAMMVARHIFAPSSIRKAAEDADIIVARGLEQLALARRIVGGRPLVYECLDIHRSLLGDKPQNRALRLAEARLLPRVDLLLTSSPAFIREYFAHRPALRAPTLLLENKLLRAEAPPLRIASPPAGPPWTIGWFGMLRCRRTLEALVVLARTMHGEVNVLIAGRPSAAEFPLFAEIVGQVPNLRFVGEYDATDLEGLYGQCHFAWTIDWFEQGLNSQWLLPNRLYEASASGCVPIVLRDVEVGTWLSRHDAGLRVRSAEEIAERLNAMTPGRYAELRAAVRAIPVEALVATQADCTALVERLAALVRR